MKRSTRIVLRLLVGLVLAFGLAACGASGGGGGDDGGGDDGGGGGNGGGETREVGFLAVSETTSEDQFKTLQSSDVTAAGGFVRSDVAFPDAFFNDPWAQLRETCEVYTLDLQDPLDQFPLPDELEFTFLDAGDPITISASGQAGVYLTANREQFTFEGTTITAYSSGEPIAGPIQGDLSATVPGGQFPGVTNAGFPSAPAFVLTSPASGSVATNTTFEWTNPTNDADTIVTIDFSSGAFTKTPTFVTCYATDDGSFSMPSETRAELGGSFSGTMDAAAREAVRVQAIGDARLVLAITRGEEFPFVIPFSGGPPAP